MISFGYDPVKNKIYIENRHARTHSVLSKVYFSKYSGSPKGRKANLTVKELQKVIEHCVKDITLPHEDEVMSKKQIKAINQFLFYVQEKYDYEMGVKNEN
ncbi:MAG: hypothetical protein E6R13_03930 [Spirochaetes bacterium]|nr:MAG: hypothetical protein E6R13_03930 [Spirochaetota bacterium]